MTAPGYDPLKGVRFKLGRSYEQLIRLRDEIRAWEETEPVVIRSKFNTHGTKEYAFVQFRRRIDAFDWGTLVGDFVHDLRSALDHLAWALASIKGPPPAETSFPICNSPGAFYEWTKSSGKNHGRKRRRVPKGTRVPTRTCGFYKITGMRPDAQAFIERLQPYHGDLIPQLRSLAHLQALDNVAKHRIVPVMAVNAGITGDKTRAGSIVRYQSQPNGLYATLKHGALWATVDHSTPCHEMEMDFRVKPFVAIPAIQGGKSVPLTDRPLGWTDLFWMWDTVRNKIANPARVQFFGGAGGFIH